MNVFLKIRVKSVEELDALLGKVAVVRAELGKKCPDIVVNVEVEMK